MPRVHINFRYSEADSLAVLRAHKALDDALRSGSVGHIEYHDPAPARVDRILAQARDGMHQIGAARMSAEPKNGVVDPNCRVHGLDNLFLASTCVFPSSGQANPTFLGVALALRLSDHLAASTRTA